MAAGSIFTDPSHFPAEASLKEALEEQFPAWDEVTAYALSAAGDAHGEWNYSKQGWNYRIKGKKNVIIYMMPCAGHFIASLVLGKAASEAALSSTISDKIKDIIADAKVYAEGRGFRIPVTGSKMVADIRKLIDIKLQSKR